MYVCGLYKQYVIKIGKLINTKSTARFCIQIYYFDSQFISQHKIYQYSALQKISTLAAFKINHLKYVRPKIAKQ